MSDLRERVPGHSLIDELLRQWDTGTIHVDEKSGGVVIDEEAVGWFRGVIGERRVAAILEQLGDEWTVLHSVPVGRGMSDIDHIVIGPSGVFTINTKFSPGKNVWVAGLGVFVGGFKQPFIYNSTNEARRASALLSQACGNRVPVVGVVVFVDPAKLDIKAKPGGDSSWPEIRVTRDSRLLATLAGPEIFSPDQVDRIAAAAAKSETWHRSPMPLTQADHIAQEFVALEQAVGPQLSLPMGAPRKRPARTGLFGWLSNH
jgi:Nuclease-related domain